MMKLAVIGGGGVRSMFLARSIAGCAGELGIRSLVLMDTDREKLRIFGGMAGRAAKAISPELIFEITDDPIQAVEYADYVITTIRPGGNRLRARDERTALAAGVIGQETTGAAGFSFAMRSIPALAGYCELIKKHANPDVRVFNFTNPAGLVSQALRDLGYDFTWGICDAPSGMLHQFAKYLGVPDGDISGEVYGLNHLSFFSSVKLRGEEIMDRLIGDDEAYARTDLRFFESALVRRLGCIPNEYLYYYYYPDRALANMLKAEKTRGEIIEEINQGMIRELASMDIDRDFDACLKVFEKWYGRRENEYMAAETGVRRDTPWTFNIHSPDEGGYAGVALKVIRIGRSGKSGAVILCAPNEGAIAGLEERDVVELSCDIGPGGIPKPRPVGRIDERQMELIRRVKWYERFAVQAILENDEAGAAEALMFHPLINSYSIAKQLASRYFAYNREFLDRRSGSGE
jgi:6-phospho-beta-glucosidase